MPGAYLVNGLSSSNNELWQLPIFGSVRNLTSMGFGNVDNFYYIMPGYKIELYRNSEYNALSQTIDNTDGTKIMYKQIVTPSPNPTGIFGDDCNSIKMFYEGVEIANKYTYTIYGQSSGTPPATTPITTLTSGSHKLLNLSLFPGAYLINSPGVGCMAIFFSITSLNTFIDQSGDREDCVLVMPGYKLILYSGNNHTGTYVAINNTEGTTIIVGLSTGVRDLSDNVITGGWTPNNILSCKLFFNGNEVIQTDIAVTQTS